MRRGRGWKRQNSEIREVKFDYVRDSLEWEKDIDGVVLGLLRKLVNIEKKEISITVNAMSTERTKMGIIKI